MRFVGIDPSTKTGLVILSGSGSVLFEKEITSKVKVDPQRFIDIAENVTSQLTYDDVVVIEGFSFGSKGKAVSTQYGIGWALRIAIIESGNKYIEVPPTVLKKFATGKGNVKKDELVLPIFKRWGYEHSSDNVRDAFVLAQIGRALHGREQLTKVQEESLKKVI